MSLLDALKSKAATEIQTLKTDARDIEARIEDAFSLGVVQSRLAQIEADGTELADKLKAAYNFGKSAA